MQLCDEALGTRLCQTCWSDEPESSVPSCDATLCDTTSQDAVTVPTCEPFIDPFKDVLPPSPPLPDSSVQEAISFEKCCGVPQAEE
jgi:hypothetical protein